MNIKDEYERLYKHWLKEFRNTDIVPLSNELFNDYKKNLDVINKSNKNQQTDTRNKKVSLKLFNSFKDNFNYLFNDLLKIREIKILNAALALQEINLNNLLEAEKLFYKNLISDIKGYEKVKTLSINDGLEIEKYEKILETNETAGIQTNDIEPKENLINETDAQSVFKNEEFSYILIKFLRGAPPLVGIDLINYGPFNKEDIAFIPLQNAKILISEKFAEKIDLS